MLVRPSPLRAGVTATVGDACAVRMEETLRLWVEIAPVDCGVLHPKALS